MKGVILGINPATTLIDLSHQVPPQDIQTASFQLASAYPYFPAGTVHLVVVDPGVGSQRQAIAIDLGDSVVVGPNNGVFSHLLTLSSPQSAVCLDNPQYWMKSTPSNTFHGRDIFAPVAAHLSRGVPIAEIGSPFPLENLVRGQAVQPHNSGEGTIQAIDHFGNLITSISGEDVLQADHWKIGYQEQWLIGRTTYSDALPGEAIALVGSHGWIEIAINQGNAQAHFQGQLNDRVQLKIEPN